MQGLAGQKLLGDLTLEVRYLAMGFRPSESPASAAKIDSPLLTGRRRQRSPRRSWSELRSRVSAGWRGTVVWRSRHSSASSRSRFRRWRHNGVNRHATETPIGVQGGFVARAVQFSDIRSILRITLRSRAARQRVFRTLSPRLARMMLYAKDRRRAAISGFFRMREESSAKATSRT